MKTFSATNARNHFGEIISMAQAGPVRITRKGKVAGVMVSAADYEAMRNFYADRLRKTMDACARHAARAGLTEAKLAELLADES